MINGKFRPLYFEFHSNDEKVLASKVFCNLLQNSKFQNINLPFHENQPNFYTFHYWGEFLKNKNFVNVLIYDKQNKNLKFSKRKKTYSFIDHQVLGIVCHTNTNKSIPEDKKEWRLKNEKSNFSIFESREEKSKADFIGILQVNLRGNWYRVSSLMMDYHKTKLICKYFGYNNGFLYITREMLKDNPSAHFTLNCKNASVLNDCKIENLMEEWLNRFYVTSFNILCTHREFSKFSNSNDCQIQCIL